MAHQAGTYWDSNPHVVASLAAQKADYLFGGGTIVLAFVGQLASVFVSPDRGALSEGGARLVLWLAVPVTVASFCLLRIGSKKLAKRYASQIDESIKARAEEQAAA